jgi:hypothetical protein
MTTLKETGYFPVLTNSLRRPESKIRLHSSVTLKTDREREIRKNLRFAVAYGFNQC